MTHLHSRRPLREMWQLGKGKCLFVVLGISVLTAPGGFASDAGQSGVAPVYVAQDTAGPNTRQHALTKLQDLQAKLEAWAQRGGDHAKVAPFGQRINKHMVAGEYTEAEKVMDEALALIGAGDQAPQDSGQKLPEPLAPVASGMEATKAGEPVRTSAPEAFVGAAYNTHAKSSEGHAGMIETMELMRDSGLNAIYAQSPWSRVETAPGKIPSGAMAPILNHILDPFPEFETVILVFKVVDTNVRVMPKDLANKDFDDPEVLQRLDSIVDAIATQSYSQQLTHVILGNEVDAYLSQHPGELAAFSTLYQRFVDRMHEKLPDVKIGTINTFNGSVRFPHIFEELVQYSDFVDFTYYPVRGLVGGNRSAAWNMRPVAEVAGDIQYMARLANGKPFGFTEIGYSASRGNQSSENIQADFVREMYRVLDPYRAKGQIEFLLFHMLFDPPDREIQKYARQQGVDSAAFREFMSQLGLRVWSDGAPREAWGPFIEGAKSWNSGAPLPADWWEE